jgi:hypothetical protein
MYTLESLKIVEPALTKLVKEDLPIRVAYQLSKFIEIVSKEMIKLEELRQELVRRYGEENEGVIRVTEENSIQFNRDYGELVNVPVDVGNFTPIDINLILGYSDRMEVLGRPPINLSAQDIAQLKLVGVFKEGD